MYENSAGVVELPDGAMQLVGKIWARLDHLVRQVVTLAQECFLAVAAFPVSSGRTSTLASTYGSLRLSSTIQICSTPGRGVAFRLQDA